MIRVRISHRPIPVLDIDLENRPLSYTGNGFTSAEITAIAWSWIGTPTVHSLVLVAVEHFMDERGRTFTAAEAFGEILGQLLNAGMVTGHYIRKHDLPLLNGMFLERGLPPLPELLVHDTHGDLIRRKDLPASQEALASYFQLPEAKHHMSQGEWREANRLTPEGIAYTRKRCVSDVLQHKALRKRLLEIGALRAPRWWKP